ncbi:hypothetical protein VNI00_000459 [Paramarasmius palmivorus]|uniref:Uncharacterized protein n=1 Tax=Paramarasmius palmivorus TaxID=297713 RepID=A0AAW0EBL3_9AGAR
MTFLTNIEIDFPLRTDLFGSEADGKNDPTTYYLFIRPLTKLSEVEGWLNGEPFFWSLDENGTTQIPESTREQLALPTVTPSPHESAKVFFHSWPKSTYDAVYKWQVAKGFDPSTLDFAHHSLGKLSFEDDRLAEENQFEEVIKEEPKKPTESESPNIVTVTTQSDLDESFLSRLTKLSWWQATEDIPAFG